MRGLLFYLHASGQHCGKNILSLTLYKKIGIGGTESSVECVHAVVRGLHILDNKLMGQTIRGYGDLVLLTCLKGVGSM